MLPIGTWIASEKNNMAQMAESITDPAYDFKDADAVVLIEVLPHRYVRMKIDGKQRTIAQVRTTEVRPDGKSVVKWDKESGRVWVTSEVADQLTATDGEYNIGEGQNIPANPIAKVIKTRTTPKPEPVIPARSQNEQS